jgi:hypothetical protein
MDRKQNRGTLLLVASAVVALVAAVSVWRLDSSRQARRARAAAEYVRAGALEKAERQGTITAAEREELKSLRARRARGK